ncbi:alginate O-acetyltransferase AlgF [Curvibacter sp. APW13]|uniref:alginate O-acetyltransferase AlgF n=1 Tax=Curvibacter sp. APW13 TaxID=3077236 RepID=UPI0028E07D5E|nr:alginate O-acetyltransferase AlgF [Curvibacter sp. APW13]MDT8990059.1 alginate O-acetyltransferase AlgF [Curvibacter sp. APW13]
MFKRILLGIVVIGALPWVWAQGNGRLYDPEPPADSAYVRVVVSAKSPAMDVAVDGAVRFRALPGQEVSDYMVLPGGGHTVALQVTGKSQVAASKVLEVQKGKSLTLVFSAAKGDARTTVFEDKGNTNKLKATLTTYNLGTNGSLDIATADGANKVFTGLAAGSSSSIQVNPIAVELMAKNDKGQGKVKLEMAQGGTYSVMAFEDAQGRPSLKVFQGRVERYTGQ